MESGMFRSNLMINRTKIRRTAIMMIAQTVMMMKKVCMMRIKA